MLFLPVWFTLSITSSLASTAFNFLSRYLLKDGDDATAYAWYNEALRFVIFFGLAFFDWRIIITPYSLLLFVLVGLSEFIGGYFYMKMHAYNELSISTILYRTRLVWVAIISFFFLGEQLQMVDYLGILIIFFGVTLTAAPKKLFIDKGVKYASLAGFVVAINVVLIKMLLPYGSPAVINTAMAIPAIFLFPLFMKHAATRITTLFKTNVVLKTLAVILSVAQLLIFTFALQFGDASKVNAVYQSMMVISVLAGIIFLKERRDIGKKLLGAGITIVGVVLLTLSW